jgi:hypothetical protein
MNFIKLIESKLIENKNNIRLGSLGDGGYELSYKKIRDADILFSGGISSNVEFEYDVFRMNKDIKIVMVDPTVSSSKLLGKGIARFFFKKKDKLRYLINALTFILLSNSERVFHKSIWINKKNTIFSILSDTLESHKKEHILLKLDIEGSEYDILDEVLLNLGSFNTMIFEFHDLNSKSQDLIKFIEDCESQFCITAFNINPAGGMHNGLPRVIELTFESKTSNK